jgi:hypothetical protein
MHILKLVMLWLCDQESHSTSPGSSGICVCYSAHLVEGPEVVASWCKAVDWAALPFAGGPPRRCFPSFSCPSLLLPSLCCCSSDHSSRVAPCMCMRPSNFCLLLTLVQLWHQITNPTVPVAVTRRA